MSNVEEIHELTIDGKTYYLPTDFGARSTVLNHLVLVLTGKKHKMFFMVEDKKFYYSAPELKSAEIKLNGNIFKY